MTSLPEVPWLVEGGARTPASIARNLAHMAAGGVEGIVHGADLEVRELEVPGSSIRVFPGTFAVSNRAAGAKDEMYVDRINSEVEVPIAATGASQRHDLIVARIENPYAAGETWPDPADPAVGPYASIAVISGVPAGTNDVDSLGLTEDHTMIPLARLDIPASTGTITQAMIVDLRTMANAVSHRDFEILTPTATYSLTSTSYVNFGGAETLVNLDVPRWATHVRTRVLIAGALKTAGNVNGDLRVQVGFGSGAVSTAATRYDMDSANADRVMAMAGSRRTPVPKTDRGAKGIAFRLEGRKNSGTAELRIDNRTTISFEVEFINEPESNV